MNGLDLEYCGELKLRGETWSTPAICRVDGRAIVIAGDREGTLSAFDGTSYALIWRRQLGQRITASPVILDKGGDHETQILIGTHENMFVVLRARDGAELWRQKTLGPVRAAAAAADLDGDGNLEIIVGTYGPEICVFSHDGALRWKRRRPKHVLVGGTKRGIVGAPLVYDVDRDGEPEIVVVGRSPWIICYDRNGNYKWFSKLRYDCDSPPSFAMVGGRPLVLIGGGEHTAGHGDNALIALDGRTGEEVWRAETGGGVDSAATISRLPSGRVVAFCGTLASAKVMAVDVATGRPLWSHQFGPSELCDHSIHDPQQPAGDRQCRLKGSVSYFTGDATCRSYTTPLVLDLDGDGNHEVVAGSNNGSLVVLDAETGKLRFAENTGAMVRGSFVIDDIDNDGRSELCVPCGDAIRIYRVPANPVAVRFFKGTTNMLGADFEPPAADSKPRRVSDWLRLRVWWDLQAKDLLRWGLTKVDEHILRKLGKSMFDYYY